MYFQPDTNTKYNTHSEIRTAFTNVMFPTSMDDEMLEYHGVFPVQPVAHGAGFDKIVTEDTPQLVEGTYYQTWIITDDTPENVQAKLDALKTAKNHEINLARAAANQTTFPYLDKVIACDALSRSDIDAVANSISLTGALPVAFPGAWKAVDNSYVMLPDVDAFKAMYAAMVAQGTENFNHSQSLKAALLNATNDVEVAAIIWG